jgi:replication initiation protein RepC
MSFALLAAQQGYRDIPEGKTVDKWKVYRDLCEGKTIIGVSDRSLAVLAALISFYPDSELNAENGLIVFPSNKQLSLRAHGMADATLRRHLGALLDCKVILRRDSPNGKRYARKGRAGDYEAFGFSLAPLLVRADEFKNAAEHVRADNAALRLMRERVTLHRRDISKLIEAALAENIPGEWSSLWSRFRAAVEAIPRRATYAELEDILVELTAIRNQVDKLLNFHINTENMSGNESQNERQQSNSHTNSLIEFEPASKQSRMSTPSKPTNTEPAKGYPLELILKACPDISEYATAGINTWRDFMATAVRIKGYLAISHSAYADALDVLGQEKAAIVIACILQRAQEINSAGGYLRALTEKARAGTFSVGPMLMAALKMQVKQRAANTG